MSIVDELRTCVEKPRDVFHPYWEDHARRLMNWAADVIEAADKVIQEKANNELN